ncbi:MAG: LiaI-LiaF-like domain-containing protein [Thermoanaerobaculaceae bacterium]
MSTELPQNLPPQPPVTPERRKAPGLAVFFSLLPGLGHIYLGLHQQGIAFFAAFLASLWLSDHADLSGAVVAFMFFYAMIDAYQKAMQPTAGATPPRTANSERRANLTLGVFLVVTGTLVLYSNFYPLDLSFLADWWPLGLIILGIYLLAKDFLAKRQAHKPPEQS